MEELVLTDPVVKPEEVSNKLRVVSLLLNHDTISVLRDRAQTGASRDYLPRQPRQDVHLYLHGPSGDGLHPLHQHGQFHDQESA